MPSKSAAQARLFAAVAHDPKFAKKVGISQAVGKDFNQADKGTDIRKKKKKKHLKEELEQIIEVFIKDK